jgi:hypothetical protein
MLFIMSLNFTERGIREIKDDPAAGVALQKTAASRASDGPRAALFVTETSRSVEELDACFVVRDASGQKLGYFYYEEEARVGETTLRRQSPAQPDWHAGGSRPTWRSCRSCCGRIDRAA